MGYFNKHLSILKILLLFTFLAKCDIYSYSETIQKNKKEDLISINKSNLTKNDEKKIKYKKRKLEYDRPEWLEDLKIYLELFNFNEKIPDNYKKYKNIFINSMEKAKTTLESLLQIYFLAKNEIIIKNL